MNPAVITLLRAHLASRFRRIRTSFSSPRRLVLTLTTVVLAVVWLGQTIFSVLMRDPYEPTAFRSSVAMGLMAYFVWHIVRVAWKRPDEAIEWSPEEQELIVDGPFSRSDILTYRACVIFTSTFPKALLTWFVLWPDLGWVSPIGILLSLVCLELFRMVMDLGSHCFSNKGYQRYRVIIAVSVIIVAGLLWSGVSDARRPGQALMNQLHVAQTSLPGTIISSPFHIAADVFVDHGSRPALLVRIAGIVGVVIGMAWFVRRLDGVHQQRILHNENNQIECARQSSENTTTANTVLPRLPFGGIFGPLAWRQCKRANRYAGSLAVSMGIPAVLSLMPLYSVPDATVAFIAVVCGVLFYTFVLLPEAIKFDFRLDSDHLSKLKMLPISSTRIVLGQLLTPISLACGFQAAVILLAAVVRDVSPLLVIVSLGLVIPLTVLFVALDNVIFLLYPHRPTQEGFEAFLRTILKFTGKSLLLLVAGGMLVLWAPVAAWTAGLFDRAISPSTIFFVGVCTGVTAMAWFAMQTVVRAYDRFDVSLDSVG